MKLKDDKYTHYAKQNIIRTIMGEQVRFVHGTNFQGDFTIAYIRDDNNIYASKVIRCPKYKDNRNVARMYASQKLLSYFRSFDIDNRCKEVPGILTEEDVSGFKVETVDFNHYNSSVIIDNRDLLNVMSNLIGGFENLYLSQGALDYMVDQGAFGIRMFKHSFISHALDTIFYSILIEND